MRQEIENLKKKIERLHGQRTSVERDLKEAINKHEQSTQELIDLKQALVVINLVANSTQSQLKFNITELGSMALESIMEENIRLNLDFDESRGRTTAKFQFVRGELVTDPIEGDSGGACEFVSEAIRDSLWTLQLPRSRPLMIRDEPFKTINDPTRAMHKRAAQMLKKISSKLKLQFLIVTMLDELEEVADRVIQLPYQA